MAVTYTVTEEREEEMDFTGDKDSFKITWNKTFIVEVAVSGADTLVGTHIINVMRADGLPVVNRSVYTAGDQIIPYVFCRSKTCKRDPKRLSRYTVSTKWSSGSQDDNKESDNDPQDKPAAVTDISPRIETTLGEVELVRYSDKNDKECLTPSRNFFDQPFVERIPTLQLKITQYENSITFDQMLERKLKVNSTTYRGHPRYDWLIEDVEAHEAEVSLSGGGTATVALVTYTLSYSPFLYGWKEDRALIDTHYYDAGDKRAFRDDENRTLTYGYVTAAGADNTAASIPDYDQWEMQDEIDFNSFLRA